MSQLNSAKNRYKKTLLLWKRSKETLKAAYAANKRATKAMKEAAQLYKAKVHAVKNFRFVDDQQQQQ